MEKEKNISKELVFKIDDSFSETLNKLIAKFDETLGVAKPYATAMDMMATSLSLSHVTLVFTGGRPYGRTHFMQSLIRFQELKNKLSAVYGEYYADAFIKVWYEEATKTGYTNSSYVAAKIEDLLNSQSYDYLCRCNNCMALLVDKNPQTNAVLRPVPESAPELVWGEDDGDECWVCPNCKTDGYLTDEI